MAQAPPFPQPWGFDQLIGTNKTNLLNASVEAWKNAGRELNATTGLPVRPDIPGMGAAIMFGMIPFVVGAIIYNRNQDLINSSLGMLLSVGALHVFKLIEGPFLYALYIITVLGLALSIMYTYWNKD